MMPNFIYCSHSCKWISPHNDRCVKYDKRIQVYKRGYIRCIECNSKIGHTNKTKEVDKQET